MTRDETNVIIRQILGALNATIKREPEAGYVGGFIAQLPSGECFYISAKQQGYGAHRDHRIAMSSAWGQYETTSGGGYGRAERSLAKLSSSCFLGRGEEGLGIVTFDPQRPLNTLLKDAERRFFKRLRELWPRAEEFRAQQSRNVAEYLDTVRVCNELKHRTRAGYALAPRRIGHAGAYASFELDIPKEKLSAFFDWCAANEVAR